ncbi:chorismate pyruvate-lyase family protein [Bacillus cereus]|uniref:chorismate pyruvate-lyase family protein n=1 Tax=Bacillus cereus TaxID=1396 RepID=UPI000BFB71D1|nr:chorismate pyruvate-lyase family protein [Bacillus cereus]PGT20582.1 cold-shock protein [Bacillus cereus]
MLVVENRKSELTYNVQAIKNILFSGDTPSIRALEKLLNDTVQLDVLEQEVIDRQYIPKEVKNFFDKNGTFIYRVSNVSYKGKVLSENLIFVDTSFLPDTIKQELENGNIPVEKLIEKMEVRRNVLYEGYQPSGNIIELFDGCSVAANVYPTRKYQIISNCKCIFYICEVYHAENIKELLK